MMDQPLYLVSRAHVVRIARIMGESLAAALAVSEHDRRTGQGEDVRFVYRPRAWFVGPTQPPQQNEKISP